MNKQERLELFAEELPIEAAEMGAEQLPTLVSLAGSTISTAGTVFCAATAPCVSTGSSFGTASSTAP